jgi:flagellar motor switch protein FliM
MDRAVGSITTCIPIANLESVKSKLITTFQREQSGEDILLQRILRENIKNIPVSLKVELGKAIVPASDIVALDIGDILQLDRRKDDLLPGYVEGVRKYMGTPGVRRGSKAFLIKRKVFDRERE